MMMTTTMTITTSALKYELLLLLVDIDGIENESTFHIKIFAFFLADDLWFFSVFYYTCLNLLNDSQCESIYSFIYFVNSNNIYEKKNNMNRIQTLSFASSTDDKWLHLSKIPKKITWNRTSIVCTCASYPSVALLVCFIRFGELFTLTLLSCE